jgi:hypothetical protein
VRAAWPDVQLAIRADAGFALPALYDYCERERIAYTVALLPNARLIAHGSGLLATAVQQSVLAGGEKVRLIAQTGYQAGSWSRARRVVSKAEAQRLPTETMGTGRPLGSIRFVVTSRDEAPTSVYDWYTRRGATEKGIKDFKRDVNCDRLSCHRFVANQFRLLHGAAYWLLDTLRRMLVTAGMARLTLETIRLRVVKIGGRVRQWPQRVRVHLASSHPGQPLWRLLPAAHPPL